MPTCLQHAMPSYAVPSAMSPSSLSFQPWPAPPLTPAYPQAQQRLVQQSTPAPSAKINISYSILFNLTTSYSSYFGGKKGISRNKTSFFLLMPSSIKRAPTKHTGITSISPISIFPCCYISSPNAPISSPQHDPFNVQMRERAASSVV